MNTTVEQLKPCPFCGGTDISFERGTNRRSTIYTCEDCGCNLETAETWQAPTCWNTRFAEQSEVQDA